MIVDFHVHVVHPEVLRQTGNRNVVYGWGTKEVPPPDPEDVRTRQVARMLDPALQVEDMDRLGIDRFVLSASTVVQNTTWAEPAQQAELERLSNDLIAQWVADRPDRFAGLATLPLEDIRLALAELERCAGLGLRGLNLPAAVAGDYLGAPRFHPLWEAIADAGLVAFLHPDGSRDLWFQEYSLWNSVGQPVEEAKLLSSLILEGVLERYPALKIVVGHGGGYLPHYFGRLDRNVTNMPDSVRNISRRPSEYLHDLYYDTCVYDVSILEAIVDRYGADHVVLGSDYPVGETDPIGFVRRARNIGTDDEPQVLGETAARLLGLS